MQCVLLTCLNVQLKDRLVSMVDDDFSVSVAAHRVLDLMKLVYISFMKLA